MEGDRRAGGSTASTSETERAIRPTTAPLSRGTVPPAGERSRSSHCVVNIFTDATQSLLISSHSPIPGVVELNGDTPPADDIMSDPEKESRVKVYRDLWERGYTLTSGLKYGADYLVYQGDPTLVHSRFMALVLPWKQPVLTLASLCRVGSKVAKSVLLCSVEQGLVRYQTLEWNPV